MRETELYRLGVIPTENGSVLFQPDSSKPIVEEIPMQASMKDPVAVIRELLGHKNQNGWKEIVSEGSDSELDYYHELAEFVENGEAKNKAWHSVSQRFTKTFAKGTEGTFIVNPDGSILIKLTDVSGASRMRKFNDRKLFTEGVQHAKDLGMGRAFLPGKKPLDSVKI